MTDESVKTGGIISKTTFDESLSLVMHEVDRALSASPSIVRKYMKHLASSRGKFIRAVSLLTCAQDQDGRIHSNAVKFAAAVEILHLATLVHDDVIDDADIRRGFPTLQKQYGKRAAVICGDYLLCIALKLAADIPNKQDYLSLDMPDYLTKVCFGELNEQINNGNFDLTVYQYLKIISGKTAALFEASFYAGAVLSENDPSAIRKYRKLGRYLGMIFQLIDDCMDFEATRDIARKPVQSDFEQNVITLPLIHAFANLLGLKEKARKNELTRKVVDDAVAGTNAISYTRMVAKKYYDKYVKILEDMDIAKSKRKGLLSILDKAYRVF
ncbi:MAG: polyprenyl synthetase family protein [Clostridiaceae bacterium]